MYMHFFYVEKSLSNSLTTERIMRGGEWVTKMGAMAQKAMKGGRWTCVPPLYIVLVLLATKMVSEATHALRAAVSIYCQYTFALNIQLMIFKKLLDFSVVYLSSSLPYPSLANLLILYAYVGLVKSRFKNVSNLMTNSNLIQRVLLFQFFMLLVFGFLNDS